MTNGSYELNGKSNLGYVNSDSSDMPGAFHINDDNGNTFQTNSSKHVVEFLFFDSLEYQLEFKISIIYQHLSI